MKKFVSIVMAMMLVLSLVACGGNAGGSAAKEAPDLTKYYEDFMASLGEGNAPMMMELDADMTEAFYPGLNEIETKQKVMQAAGMSAVAYEFALVEVANTDDAAKVQEIFEARKETQVNGGAWYPETTAAWEKAEIIANGNVVALIVAGDQQADAVEAFKALYK